MIPLTIRNVNEAIYAMDTIHYANLVYWRDGKEHSGDAQAEHQRRQSRLVEIQARLVELVGTTPKFVTHSD